MSRILNALGAEQDGATAIAYGLIAAFIALAIIGALGAAGQETTALYQSLVDHWPTNLKRRALNATHVLGRAHCRI